MAAPSLRIVRRPKGAAAPRRHALTAAVQRLPDPSKSFKASTLGVSRDNWQDKAWEYLNLVGELRYYVGWRANSCSRCRLVMVDIDPVTGMPDGQTTNKAVAAIGKAIANGPLGQAQLVKRLTEGLTVPGESWTVVLYKGDDPKTGDPIEQWLSLTKEEIKTEGRKTTITLPDGEKYPFNNATDIMFRVWNPHPRKTYDADSPVRASIDTLEEIVRTTKTIANASKSRLIGNGVLFVPHEMSLPSPNGPTSSDKPGVVDPPMVGTPAVQQLTELLFQIATAAVDDEDSMAALIPIIAGVPGEQVKNVNHLKFDNQVTEIAIKTRNDAIARLAMGLDVAPERLLGIGSNSNHWSAWQIGDDDVRLHIAPVMETICQAINEAVIKPVLEREGLDPDKFMLWYDTSELTADPDLKDEATNAFDRGQIRGDVFRELQGLGDVGYDFDKIEGWKQWAIDRVAADPDQLPKLLPLLDAIAGLEFEQPQSAIEQAPPDQQDPADDGQHEPNTEDNADGTDPNADGEDPNANQSTAAIERSRGDVELAFVDLYVGRCLELSGKRRRSRSDMTRLRDVPVHQTHRYMPPVAPTEVARLISGWDDTLEDGTLARLGISTDRIRAAVRREALRILTSTVIDAEVIDPDVA